MIIRSARPEEWEETIRLAFRHLNVSESDARIDSLSTRNRLGMLSPDGIFRAEDGGRHVGSLVAQRRPDGNVSLWVPTMTDGHSIAPFFEPLECFCRRVGAPAAIALVDRGQSCDRDTLISAGGFEQLSDLLYLVATTASLPGEKRPKHGPVFVSVAETPELSEPGRLERVVAETYRNTRDFPRLMDIMPVDKVLDSYRIGIPFRPELWFVLRDGNRDLGILLLSDPGDDLLELTYMGLIEEARGRGLGKEIVRFALRTALEQGRSMLLTAADEMNAAAMKVYLDTGFRVWDRKKIFVRFFR